MTDFVRFLTVGLICVCLLAGCGEGGGATATLVSATGSVTYNGAPLAGATVTFVPAEGPLALAVTDTKGEFKLNSGALPGCAVGPSKVSVSVVPPGEGTVSAVPTFNPSTVPSAADMAEASKRMAEMTQKSQSDQSTSKPKSLIPERYNNVGTSGLAFTVEKDSSKNNFKIELKD